MALTTLIESAPGQPAAAGPGRWLTFRHPEYQEHAGDWCYTRDHYTGDILRPDKVTTYLLQKRQGESNEAFRERARNSDYTNHMAAIVDSLVGMLAAVDGDTSRVWGPTSPEDADKVLGLGDPKDQGSPAARLWRNADGHGTKYETFWHQVAVELSLTHCGWLMVDPADGDPRFLYLPPEKVVNWREEGGRLVEVLIQEEQDLRASIRSVPSQRRQFLLLTLQGWERWQLTQSGAALRLGGPGDFGVWQPGFFNERDDRVLPILPIRLPMKRQVGYYLARKCNAVFNRESERDFLLRVANFPKFLVAGDQTAFDKVRESFRRGDNLIHGTEHTYAAPGTESATLAGEVIDEKARGIYRTTFREYGDAAQQRTATEVKQDAAAGASAYLSLLSSALDGAETWALHMAEQVLFPTKKALHFQAVVERSRDFLPADPEIVIDRLISRVFGKDARVPLGRTAQIDAARQIASWMGLSVDRDEIAAAVVSTAMLELMGAAVQMPWPSELRVAVVAKVIASNGIIDPEEEIKLADGQEVKLLQVLKEKAQQLADAQDQAKALEAQYFGPGTPTPPQPPPPPPAGGQ